MKYSERFDPDGVPWPQGLKRLSTRYKVVEGQLRSWFLGGCGIDSCTRTSLVVDHDHECCLRTPTCGKCTRGVLCSNHNSSLEAFMDSPAVLAYLRRSEGGRATLARRFTVNETPINYSYHNPVAKTKRKRFNKSKPRIEKMTRKRKA